jgi:hypothetical protein
VYIFISKRKSYNFSNVVIEVHQIIAQCCSVYTNICQINIHKIYFCLLAGKAFRQRGLIYTEHKPLGRLYKKCYPFFHEFRVIPSANGFMLVFYTATLFTTEAVCQRVDPDRRLAHLSRKSGGIGL